MRRIMPALVILSGLVGFIVCLVAVMSASNALVGLAAFIGALSNAVAVGFGVHLWRSS